MFCSKCGRRLRDDDNFCAVCGAPVDSGAKPADSRVQPADPGDNLPPEPPGFRKAGGRKGKSSLSVPAAIVIIVAAVALILAFGEDGGGPAAGKPASSSASGGGSPITHLPQRQSIASEEGEKEGDSITSQPSSAPGLGNVRPVRTADGRLPEDAREIAIAAGKEVFSGTLEMTTFAKRAAGLTPKLQGFEGDDTPIALLTVDADTSVGEAVHAGDPDGTPMTGSIEAVSIGISTSAEQAFWSQLDGQEITVASYPSELYWPSDVAGALYSVEGPCELLAYSG